MRHYFTTTIVKNRRDVAYDLRYAADIRDSRERMNWGFAICLDKKISKALFRPCLFLSILCPVYSYIKLML